MNRTRIFDCVEMLYSKSILKEWEATNNSLFYFIKDKLSWYESMVKVLDKNDFSACSDDIFFKGSFTFMRFNNLIHRLVEGYIHILQSCYKGDIYYSCDLLYNLLLGRKNKLNQYLVEPYINYFDFEVVTDNVFYRMRDEKSGIEVKDCSHVPFNLRKKIDSNRFSLQGLPCLYLADSRETADKELGTLNDEKCRWVSEFVLKRPVYLFDMRFRSMLFNQQMDEYEYFKLLITYPIRLLCSLKVKDDSDSFHEEYYIPQLLSHLILVYLKENQNHELYHGTEGIIFDSTKNEGGYNLIIPALYKDKNPPQMGHSPHVKNMFEERSVTIFKESLSTT